MTTPNRSLGAAVGAAVFASVMTGQELRLLDNVGIASATYDAARARVVAIGYDLETREFDGVRWRTAPQQPPAGIGDVQVVFDPLHGRTLACWAMAGSNMTVASYDGVQWRPIPTPVAPPERHAFACVFDVLRGQLVLFGGFFAGYTPTNETWTFDGSTWTQRSPASAPPANVMPPLAYDTVRGRTVLFDGGNGPSPPETWEWDGTNWNRVTTVTTPSARRFAAMAFDPARARTVVFGGVDISRLDDLWEYDGIDWRHLPAPGGPSARYAAMCVFDATLGETRVFSGSPDAAMSNAMWSWNGTRWLRQSMPAHPGARGVSLGAVAATMADPLGRGLVMYYPDPQASTRTWRWDATGWQPVAGASPPARFETAACGSLLKSYMQGGLDATTGNALSELWSFDGSAWTLEPATGPGPAPRRGQAISHDLFRNELVLFGGTTTQSMSAETWVFDGTNWTLRQPATSPAAREVHVMAFDIARARLVMAGGFDSVGTRLTDTWEWDGLDWSQVTTALNLPTSWGQLAYDPQRFQVVMVVAAQSQPSAAFTFDGVDWTPFAVSPSAWLGQGLAVAGFPYTRGLLVADYDSLYELGNTVAHTSHYGNACTATAPDLGSNAWPRVGDASLGIDVIGGPAGSFLALLGAVQSANVPIAGCTLLVQPGQAMLLLATSASGAATTPLPLPNDLAFLGVDLFFQVAALAPAAPSGFTLSRGLRLTIGH